MKKLLIDRLPTPLGEFTFVADARGRLCASGWCSEHERMTRYLAQIESREAEVRRGTQPEIRRTLTAYFEGELAAIDALHVAYEGTAFQREVWQALREIPCGHTLSYGELARRIGRPAAVRAVGLANGSNPIGVVVPCHRVIGKDGTLTGYGGGLPRKRWLLTHERVLLV